MIGLEKLAKLAQWHDQRSVEYPQDADWYDHHTDAAATIRAAMAEIERLRAENAELFVLAHS